MTKANQSAESSEFDYSSRFSWSFSKPFFTGSFKIKITFRAFYLEKRKFYHYFIPSFT